MKHPIFNIFPDFFNKKERYKASFVDDAPEILKSKTVYIVKNQEYCWLAVMTCPCGCKKVLYLNLINKYQPSWSYKINNRKIITLYPSIKRTIGCKSHFFIKKGKLIWV